MIEKHIHRKMRKALSQIMKNDQIMVRFFVIVQKTSVIIKYMTYQTADLLESFLQLLSELATEEFYADPTGSEFVEHCLEEFHVNSDIVKIKKYLKFRLFCIIQCFLQRFHDQKVYHLFEERFSRFTATMSGFLGLWKSNPNSELTKIIVLNWMNYVPPSPMVRWAAISENLVHLYEHFIF